MNKKERGRQDAPRTNGLVLGMLYGLAFFLPGIYLLRNQPGVDRLFLGFEDIPILTKISTDFHTGASIAGQIFLEQAAQFYERRELTAPDVVTDQEELLQSARLAFDRNNQNPEAAELAWHRDAMERKLSEKLSRGKMKRAVQFLDYIEAYRDLAAAEMIISQVPASIKLAQGLLESDAGRAYLARVANNHFGIKCLQDRGARRNGRLKDSDFSHHNLAYDCEQRADDHPWDRFEKYESPDLSFRRHSLLLTQSGRYNWMLDQYHTGENYLISREWFGTDKVPYYAAWAVGLKKGGYATGRRYAQKLAFIIETYELWRIDYEVVLSGS